ncbi:hypothetical protein Fcan01_14326 [Folsomia candida]|uniref:Uncharacterized protein n=1 Tax=Folsomia candida TaxID=158441 RepID=A0A226E1J2_FOLCA|nr:hypothetical protein Fcan01_14326 [Folsomia candida]
MGGEPSKQTFTPQKSSELVLALENAKPGDEIILDAVTYLGEFTLGGPPSTPTTPPITLRGTTSLDKQLRTIISSESTAISISSGKWIVSGLTIQAGELGVEVAGRVENTGILLETTASPTLIDTVTINMSSSKRTSLSVAEGCLGVHVHTTKCNGIASISGDEGFYTFCNFDGVNMFGNGNDFTSSSLQILFEASGTSENMFEWPGGRISTLSDTPLPLPK